MFWPYLLCFGGIRKFSKVLQPVHNIIGLFNWYKIRQGCLASLRSVRALNQSKSDAAVKPVQN